MRDAKSRFSAALVIALLALILRWRAVSMLPVDYDEPMYTRAAVQYAAAIRTGDWGQLLTASPTPEHPALVKLLYALATLVRPEQSSPLSASRTISLLFGVLQTAVLAWLSPLAAFFLAIHTMTIKYTAQAYLEALPALTSLLAVAAYERSTKAKNGTNRWLILSAMALGVTAASKYTYLIVALVIFPLLLWANRQRPWRITLYLSLALLTFFVLNVQIWANPIGGLRDSLLFHPAYSQSAQVRAQHLPWWQQLYYVSRPVPWHPGVFLFSWDTWILVLGVLGLPWLWRRRHLYVLWLFVGVGILLLWPTRWPQYTLIVTAPLCLSAAAALAAGWEWLDQHTEWVSTLRAFAPERGAAAFALLVGLLLLVAITYFQLELAEEGRGWTVYVASNSDLPSDMVYCVTLDDQGRIWAGTDQGAAVFAEGRWTPYDSNLPDNHVRAIAAERQGRIWFGTDQGLATLSDKAWHSFNTQNSGLIDDQVLCLASAHILSPTAEATTGLWIGTERGLSHFDGDQWASYTPDNSGLAGSRVLSIAIDPHGQVWVGTWGGLSMFDGDKWTSYTSRNSGLAFDTVSAVAIDAQGRIWCGTQDGVNVFDGETWRTFRAGTPGLRFSTATTLAVDLRSQVWVGGDLPVGPVGAAAMFDGERWHDYMDYFWLKQAPVRDIAIDRQGQIWFATLLDGIHVYDVFQVEEGSTD